MVTIQVRPFTAWLSGLCSLLLVACGGGGSSGSSHQHPAPPQPTSPLVTATALTGSDCFSGMAGSYPCANVDFLGGLKFSAEASDIWGWQDTLNGDDYAFVALSNGTAFVRINNAAEPEFAAFLPTATASSSWRDVKVVNGHAVVVSEAPGHGMQVVHLKGLVDQSDGAVIAPIAHYTEFGDAHNVAVNEETQFAYVVGSDTCSGGLHMIDMSDPHMPSFAGCFSADGYTHDVQCVVYWGDDVAYQGRELCFGANEDTLTIADVTDKSAPSLVAKVAYSQVGYTHQGWLSEDHNYFILGDETDELDYGIKTRTLVFDVRSITNPQLTGEHLSTTQSIDHNLYVKQNHVYQANYSAGVRILRMGDLALGELAEVAFFDTWPNSNAARFEGVWSVFPYFDNGRIVTANISGEFFVLEPNLNAIPECNDGLDNDADGMTDFPDDSACSSAETAFEQ